MTAFYQVAQASGSADCGFFCGYLLRVASTNPDPSTWQMEPNDVYAARERFLERDPPRLRPAGQFLWAHRAPEYLTRTLSLGAYTYFPNRNPRGAVTAQSFFERIEGRLATNRGVMLLVGGGAGQPAGHWVTVPRRVRAGRWAYYDPRGPRYGLDLRGLEDIATQLHGIVSFIVEPS